LANLEDADISIRRRALDLLYLICNSTNASEIVAQLLGYLENRNDPLIKDDLVLKVAILAEKYAENLKWYVDVVVKLMKNAEVENDIWYRILQIITGFGSHNAELQNYAAQRLFVGLSQPFITDTLKCVGCYVVS
jgi:AP-2 complex subunit alpha